MHFSTISLCACLLCGTGLATAGDFSGDKVRLSLHARAQYDAHQYRFMDAKYNNLDTRLSEIRRLRLENLGEFYHFVKYKISGEFSDKSKLEDAYISLLGEKLRFVIGQFYYPFGNATQGSSKYSEFMEKSSITSLVSYGRDRGFSLQSHHSKYIFLQVGFVQGRGPNVSDNNNSMDKFIRFGLDTQSYGSHKKRYVFGFSGAAGRQLAEAGDSIKIKTETRSGLTLFKAEIKENTDYLRSRLSLEGTALHDSTMYKGEFFYDHYGFDKSVHVLGYYFIASYFLTGEQRTLKRGLLTRQKVFKSLSVDDGKGAWELAMRYSAYAVNPHFFQDNGLYDGWQAVSASKYSQRGYAISTALNWYPWETIRVMFNHVLTFAKHESGDFKAVESALMMRIQAEI